MAVRPLQIWKELLPETSRGTGDFSRSPKRARGTGLALRHLWVCHGPSAAPRCGRPGDYRVGETSSVALTRRFSRDYAVLVPRLVASLCRAELALSDCRRLLVLSRTETSQHTHSRNTCLLPHLWAVIRLGGGKASAASGRRFEASRNQLVGTRPVVCFRDPAPAFDRASSWALGTPGWPATRSHLPLSLSPARRSLRLSLLL